LEAFAAEARATPLEGAAVLLLSFAAPSSGACSGGARGRRPIGRERGWVSWADRATRAGLEGAGLPVERIEIGSSVATIDFARALTNQERALQHRLFEDLQIMHLNSAVLSPAPSESAENPVESEGPSVAYQRPESPQCESLGPG